MHIDDPARSCHPIGLIGFGLLGSAIARRLSAARFDLVGFDVDPARRAAMADAGIASSTLHDIATTCDHALLAVYSAEQVEETLVALDRVATRRLRVFCATTLEPAAALDLVGRSAADLIEMVEFPISGSSGEVVAGEAFGLVGPSPTDADQPADDIEDGLLRTVTPSIMRFSEVGDASKAKLAINLVLELNRTALAEGLVFAEALGLAGELVAPALMRSAAESRVMHRKLPKMLRGEFIAEGRLAQSLKDVDSMLDLARYHRLSLPLLEAHGDLLSAGVAAGDGQLDNSAVIEELRRRIAAGPVRA